MKLIIFAALCALALGSISRRRESEESFEDDTWEKFYRRYPVREYSEKSFKSGREYRYFYDGQILTGIPGSSRQHSGSRIQSMVVLQFRGGNVVMKLNHVRIGKMNRKVPEPRAQLPFEVFEQVEIEPRLLEKLLKPVKFAYTNGLIHDIVFDRTEEAWSANIKRGVLNMLQVNLKEQSSTDNTEMKLLNAIDTDDRKSPRFYRVMEKTLEGECEVLYEIEHQPSRFFYSDPKEIMNVTKSINFERCNRRPEIKYNWRQHDFECPTCDPKYTEESKFLKASTVLKYNISGTRDDFLIETVKTESQYVVVPFNEDSNIITTYVNKTLVLYKTLPISSEIQTPSEPLPSDSGMVYTLDWDISREKFETEGEQEQWSRQLFGLSNKVEMTADLLRQLTRHINADMEIEAPKVFSRLVTLLRMATKEELEQIHRKFYLGETDSFTSEEKLKIKDLKPNAIALCGTESCLTHLFEKIVNREIPFIKAANALRQLQSIRTVSSKIIFKMERLCEEPVVREHFVTKQACYLSLGSMLRALCSENTDKWAVEFKVREEQICPRDLKEKFVQLFIRKLKESSDWETKVLMLKTLNNAGLDLSVFELAKIITNADEFYPTYLRLEAITALRHLNHLMPHKIQKILTPIYMNRWESPALRMAAVYQLMSTKPERPLLEIITKNLQTEPSLQVGSFVFSYLQSLANSSNPCLEKLKTDLKLALRFTREINPGMTYSKYVHLSMHDRYKKVGVDVEAFQIFNNRSILPQVLGMTLNKNMMGFFQRHVAKFGIATDNLEPLLYKFFGPEGFLREREFLGEILRRSPRDLRRGYESELKSIFDELKISARRGWETRTSPKAYLFFSWLGQELGFIPFSTESIQSVMDTGYFNLLQLESRLRDGIPIHTTYATLLDESEYKIPTTIGFPLKLKYREPLVMHAKGHLRATFDPATRMLHIKPELKTSLAVKKIMEIELFSPMVSSGLTVNMKAKFHLPIEGEIKVDWKENALVHVELKTPEDRKELVVLESEPLTFVRRWPETVKVWTEPETKLVAGEEHNRVVKVDKRIPFLDLKVKGRYHWTPLFVQPNTPFYPLSGPNRIVITYEPKEVRPESTIIEYTGYFSRVLEEKISPSIRSWYFEDSRSDERSSSEEPYDFSEESRESSSQSSEGSRNSLESSESDSKENSRDKSSSSSSSESREMRKSRESREFRKFRKSRELKSESSESNSDSKSESSSESKSESKSSESNSREKSLERNRRLKLTRRFREFELPEMSEPRKHGFSLKLKKRISGTPKTVGELTCGYKHNSGMEFNRFECEAVLTEAPRDYNKVIFNVESIFPSTPYKFRDVEGKKITIRSEIKIGHEGSIVLKAEAKRSEEQAYEEMFEREYYECKRFEDESNRYRSPIECEDYLKTAGAMKKLDVEIEYEKVPVEVKNVTRKLFNLVKSYLYWNTDVADINVRNPEGKIRATFVLDRESRRKLNITVKMPHENVTMIDIPVPVKLVPLNIKNKYSNSFLESILEDDFFPECKIKTDYIKTFDGRRYSVPLTTCYSVLAKDCTEERRFVVMMKKLKKGSEEKKVKILTRTQKIVLEATRDSEEVKVFVNDEPKRVEDVRPMYDHGHVVAIVRREGPYVKVELPEEDVEVHFDGYTAKVKVSPLMQGRQCGVCGHYDRESEREFELLRPDFEPEYDVRRFFHEYQYKGDEECELPTSYEKYCDDEDCRYERPSYFRRTLERRDFPMTSSEERDDFRIPMEFRSSESSESSEESNESESSESSEEKDIKKRFGKFTREDEYYSRDYIRPRKMTKIVEKSGKVCFSKKPIKMCPPSISYKTDKSGTDVEVPFVCFRRSDVRTLELVSEAERVPLSNSELETLPVEFSETVRIPEKCRRL
jgi:hypothetical protein